MKIGVSTASLFLDLNTEDATSYLANNNVDVSEAFLTAFSEYEESFAHLLNKNRKDMSFNSVHALTTQFEPQLYTKNKRALDDAYCVLEKVLKAGEIIGAKNYTFHGYARIKRTPLTINYDECAFFTQAIIDRCKKHGLSLAYENVHWCYYNYVGFFSEIKKRCPELKGTLDVKQARQSGIKYTEFLSEMGSSIATVHISDIDENGKMCLPTRGTFDFDEMFSRLSDVGFDGAVLIEAYRKDYNKREELILATDDLKSIASKYFKI